MSEGPLTPGKIVVKVRRAARDTYGTGWRLYEDLRGSDESRERGGWRAMNASRAELTEFVRSATNTVDAGIASGRRHARRRLLRLLMVATAAACFVGVGLRRRYEDRP